MLGFFIFYWQVIGQVFNCNFLYPSFHQHGEIPPLLNDKLRCAE